MKNIEDAAPSSKVPCARIWNFNVGDLTTAKRKNANKSTQRFATKVKVVLRLLRMSLLTLDMVSDGTNAI